MKDFQVRTKQGAITFFKTYNEATRWAEERWADTLKVSYTDDAGDRIVLYPDKVKGQYSRTNLTEALNALTQMSKQYYEDE